MQQYPAVAGFGIECYGGQYLEAARSQEIFGKCRNAGAFRRISVQLECSAWRYASCGNVRHHAQAQLLESFSGCRFLLQRYQESG